MDIHGEAVRKGVSWNSFFQSSSSSLNSEGLELSFIEPVCIDGMRVAQCSSAMLKAELSKWKNTLLGHFIGRRPSFTYVKEVLLKQWSISGHVDVNLLESGFFVFRFNLEEDKVKVLEGGPWTVQRRPLILRPWKPGMKLEKVELNSIPISDYFPNLPFHWNVEALSSIASVIGKPIATDKMTMTKERLSYARLCVEIEATHDVPEQVAVHDDEGLVFFQKVKYEWCPPRCNSCMIFGHATSQCGANQATRMGNK
ncbi:uncharacterized protein LOC122647916 [Telopea speciosissima]|uniref:uncharacterized protein LOC122647916 n=1 Tax=Telopea speciosissima TaxID=54955 RepID=UPI001CC6510E|nr:uncharacterized protein LOC122647916 [Telopea speciosissima]